VTATTVLPRNGEALPAVNGTRTRALSPGGLRPGAASPGGLAVQDPRVAKELRQIREESGLTGSYVARCLGWSESKISRGENSKSCIGLTDLQRLAAFYRKQTKTPAARLDALLDYARKAAARRAEGQDDMDRDEPTTVLEWAAVTVPELLRTPDYARSVLLSTQKTTRILPGAVKRAVAATAAWQERLTSDNPVGVQAVLDESVLYRRFGSPEVMREQLQRLLELSALPNVELRVLPFARGVSLAPFRYLQFDAIAGLDLSAAVVIELLGEGLRLDDEEQTFTYCVAFQQLREAAAPEPETAELIGAALRQAG
jgi:transcriptional regulator with XRE-family HTH domain